MQDKAPKRWFKWFGFRFSLRTLFVLVTIFAVWLGWQMHYIRQRQAWSDQHSDFVIFEDEIRSVDSDSRRLIPWWRSLLGDRAMAGLVFDRPSAKQDRDHALALFPEITIFTYVEEEEDKTDPQQYVHKIHYYRYDEDLQDFRVQTDEYRAPKY